VLSILPFEDGDETAAVALANGTVRALHTQHWSWKQAMRGCFTCVVRVKIMGWITTRTD
jgi:hypothetical protein